MRAKLIVAKSKSLSGENIDLALITILFMQKLPVNTISHILTTSVIVNCVILMGFGNMKFGFVLHKVYHTYFTNYSEQHATCITHEWLLSCSSAHLMVRTSPSSQQHCWRSTHQMSRWTVYMWSVVWEVTFSPGRKIPWPGDWQMVEWGQHLWTCWRVCHFFTVLYNRLELLYGTMS